MMVENVPLQVLPSTFSMCVSLKCVGDPGCQGYGDVRTRVGSVLWDSGAVGCVPKDPRQGHPRCRLRTK